MRSCVTTVTVSCCVKLDASSKITVYRCLSTFHHCVTMQKSIHWHTCTEHSSAKHTSSKESKVDTDTSFHSSNVLPSGSLSRSRQYMIMVQFEVYWWNIGPITCMTSAHILVQCLGPTMNAMVDSLMCKVDRQSFTPVRWTPLMSFSYNFCPLQQVDVSKDFVILKVSNPCWTVTCTIRAFIHIIKFMPLPSKHTLVKVQSPSFKWIY